MRVSLKQHVVQGGDLGDELGGMGFCSCSKTALVERILLGEQSVRSTGVCPAPPTVPLLAVSWVGP